MASSWFCSPAAVVEKGHGRIETRRLSVSRECVVHLGWPGATQVCRIERIRETKGRISREIAYAITSLTPEQADADALLALWRDHWLIENRLHWRRDVILGEDDSRLRSGASPQAMAALRNAMLHLVKDAPGPLRAIREALAEIRHRAIDRLGPAVRQHWAIENGLHWILDVTFHDDQSRIRTAHAPENMLTVRHIAMNVATRKKGKDSMRLALKTAGWDDDYLVRLVAP